MIIGPNDYEALQEVITEDPNSERAVDTVMLESIIGVEPERENLNDDID